MVNWHVIFHILLKISSFVVWVFRNDIPEHVLKIEDAGLGNSEVGGLLSVLGGSILFYLSKFGQNDWVGVLHL